MQQRLHWNSQIIRSMQLLCSPLSNIATSSLTFLDFSLADHLSRFKDHCYVRLAKVEGKCAENIWCFKLREKLNSGASARYGATNKMVRDFCHIVAF